MSLTLAIGLFLLWQLLVLWGALRLVRFGRGPRLPSAPPLPREWVSGEWSRDRDPVFGNRTAL